MPFSICFSYVAMNWVQLGGVTLSYWFCTGWVWILLVHSAFPGQYFMIQLSPVLVCFFGFIFAVLCCSFLSPCTSCHWMEKSHLIWPTFFVRDSVLTLWAIQQVALLILYCMGIYISYSQKLDSSQPSAVAQYQTEI